MHSGASPPREQVSLEGLDLLQSVVAPHFNPKSLLCKQFDFCTQMPRQVGGMVFTLTLADAGSLNSWMWSANAAGQEGSQRYLQMCSSFIQGLHPESCWLPCGKMYEVKVRKCLFGLQGMGRKLDLYSPSDYKIFKVLCSLCRIFFFFFLVSRREKIAQASLHSNKDHLFKSHLTWPSSWLMGETSRQSMDSSGFPGRMVSPCEECWKHCSML